MSGPRVGALAGLGFVLVGIVELALTGGPVPDPAAAIETSSYFVETRGAAPVVAVLSAVAGLLFLVFAVQLRRLVHERVLADLIWAGAVATVVLAWAGQAAQQTAWLAVGTAEPALGGLGALVGSLFGFALVGGGGVVAGGTSVAALREEVLPTWLGVIGLIAAGVALVGVGSPVVARVAFPVFLVWLLATSVLLARQPAGRSAASGATDPR